MKLQEAVTTASVGNVPPIGFTHENDEYIQRPIQIQKWMKKKKKKCKKGLLF